MRDAWIGLLGGEWRIASDGSVQRRHCSLSDEREKTEARRRGRAPPQADVVERSRRCTAAAMQQARAID